MSTNSFDSEPHGWLDAVRMRPALSLSIVGMIIGIVATLISLSLGLFTMTEKNFLYTIIGVGIGFVLLLMASFSAADAFAQNLPTRWIKLLVLFAIAIGISFFSFTFWFEIFSKGQNLKQLEAEQKLVTLANFNNDANEAMSTAFKNRFNTFAEDQDKAVATFVLRMEAENKRFNAFIETDQDESSVKRFLENEVVRIENDIGDAEKRQKELDRSIPDLEAEKIAAEASLKDLELEEKSAAYRSKLITALSMEKNETRKFVPKPDLARVLLLEMSKDADLLRNKYEAEADLTVCKGAAPSIDERNAPGYKPAARGTGAGNCSLALERGLTFVDSFIKSANVARTAFKEIKAELTSQQDELIDLNNNLDDLSTKLGVAKRRLSAGVASNNDLMAKARAFLADRGIALADRVESYDAVIRSCETMGKLADGVAFTPPVDCSDNVVGTKLAELEKFQGLVNAVSEICSEEATRNILETQKASVRGADLEELFEKYRLARQTVQDGVVTPCLTVAGQYVEVGEAFGSVHAFLKGDVERKSYDESTDRFFKTVMFQGASLMNYVALTMALFTELLFFLSKSKWDSSYRILSLCVQIFGRYGIDDYIAAKHVFGVMRPVKDQVWVYDAETQIGEDKMEKRVSKIVNDLTRVGMAKYKPRLRAYEIDRQGYDCLNELQSEASKPALHSNDMSCAPDINLDEQNDGNATRPYLDNANGSTVLAFPERNSDRRGRGSEDHKEPEIPLGLSRMDAMVDRNRAALLKEKFGNGEDGQEADFFGDAAKPYWPVSGKR